jgi:ABC-type phosphate/phosphonate transport system substrate-binding protein
MPEPDLGEPLQQGAQPVATLPMYDWPEVEATYDAFWLRIAASLGRSGIATPAQLVHRGDCHAAWRLPNLLLSQTCGFPYVSQLRGMVQLVATPHYAVSGCAGSSYSSMIIMRHAQALSLTDWGGGTAAINSTDSQSGYWALRAAIAEAGAKAPGKIVMSGSHRQSVKMVASGEADIAAIDAVCWAMAERYEPGAFACLTVIAQSPSAPSLPFITALGTPTAVVLALREAIADAIADSASAAIRGKTFLSANTVLDDAAYDRILAVQAIARRIEFPVG